MLNPVQEYYGNNYSEEFVLRTLTRAHQETRYWTAIRHGVKDPLRTYDVNLESREASGIMDKIYAHSSSSFYKIICINRIQNPYLMADYVLAKDFLLKTYGPRVRARTLLHGTPSYNINSIIMNNFDLQRVKRCRYGIGIYFTNDIMFASKFSDFGAFKYVLVANVLQHSSCKGEQGMACPRFGCDTTENLTPNSQNVIVKYHENTFYPAYVVTLKIRC